MKKILIIAVIATLLYSCKSVKYIPVQTTKIEYRDNFVRDSIFRYDSVFVKDKGDTLILERYKYLYKNKIVKDQFYQCVFGFPIGRSDKQVTAELAKFSNMVRALLFLLC